MKSKQTKLRESIMKAEIPLIHLHNISRLLKLYCVVKSDKCMPAAHGVKLGEAA